jgi:redox-sensitive bicupin YhaK (pirin superfamily)
MLEVRRGAERYRGGEAQAGIDTRHAFSFSGFYDPDNTGFGLLVACNEERLAPGAGFAEHRHRDVEIVTWVVEGVLEHRDSTGGSTLVRPGDVAHLSAGGGVVHTERNPGDEPLCFVQMWLVPGVFGGDPAYEVVRGIADATPFALPRADAVLHVRRLPAGARTAVPDAPWVYMHVVRGAVDVGGQVLDAGDAARVRGAENLEADAVGPAELLVWEMHAEPSYG